MKAHSWLKWGLLGAVLAFAAPATVNAQIVPNLLVGTKLLSFEPDPAVFFNPAFPVSTTLRHTTPLLGEPLTQYRVSRFADFRNARWLPYAQQPVLRIPTSWFSNIPSTGVLTHQVILHFQVRAKNPKAGLPISSTVNPFTGERTLKTEPAFLTSNVLTASVRWGSF